MQYKRVLLKLSGEALMGDRQYGIDPNRLKEYAKEIKEVTDKGIELAIVIGGGNIFRGVSGASNGMDRVQGDHMGMLATCINGLALQSALEDEGVYTRLQTAIQIKEIAEPYIKRKAIRHLEKGRVVIFGAGAGMPFFTTDTVAAQRALEIGVQALLLAKSGVDGVYSADPRKDKNATKYESVSYDEVLSKSLAVADAAAFALCRENKLPIVIFDLKNKGNIKRAVSGESIGTLVS